MAKDSDHAARRFPEDFLEALRRLFKDLAEPFTVRGNRFDPNDPRLLRVLVVVAAILFAATLLSEILPLWLNLGRP